MSKNVKVSELVRETPEKRREYRAEEMASPKALTQGPVCHGQQGGRCG